MLIPIHKLSSDTLFIKTWIKVDLGIQIVVTHFNNLLVTNFYEFRIYETNSCRFGIRESMSRVLIRALGPKMNLDLVNGFSFLKKFLLIKTLIRKGKVLVRTSTAGMIEQ